MNKTAVTQPAKITSSLLLVQGLLHRNCACGNHTVTGGECTGCAKKKTGLQRKLVIGASNDPLEHEADRVAGQVMYAPLNSAVNAAPPRIQRYSGQAGGGANTAPVSVDRVLSSSGRPLEPAIQHDMEQRFGHDFSQVRVHTGGAAEQSARDVNAHAYTLGNNVVFGVDRFTPGTQEGRRLLAHELTHTIQQRGRGDQTMISRATSTPTDRCKDMPKTRPPLLIKDSVHPSVREAQTKLNLFHSNEIAAGRKGLSSAPLTEDCIFGQLTFNAVLSFQQQVFPGLPIEHDGKIGSKTWAKLDSVASPLVPVPGPPSPLPVSPSCVAPTNPDMSGRGFNPTTDSQNTMIAKHPIDAISVNNLATDALAKASSCGLPGLHLGPADAFRHSFWNCRMTQELGAIRAEQFATAHENSGPSPIPFDNQMDLHDNAFGRTLGTPGANCDSACMTAVASGQLRSIRGPDTFPLATPPVPTACIGASNQPWP